MPQTKSYAASVTGNTNDSDKQETFTAPKVANLRTIMMNQKNEEILEENDRKTPAKFLLCTERKRRKEEKIHSERNCSTNTRSNAI